MEQCFECGAECDERLLIVPGGKELPLCQACWDRAKAIPSNMRYRRSTRPAVGYPRGRRRKITPYIAQRIKVLRASGVSLRAIGVDVGISHASVRAFLMQVEGSESG